MPKSRPPYSAEFRARMVELVRAGRTPEALSREFEPTAQSIWNWVRQAERDQGVRLDGLTSDEKEELRRLRREVRVLREEKEILAKAAAWFAEETGRRLGPPSTSSTSRTPTRACQAMEIAARAVNGLDPSHPITITVAGTLASSTDTSWVIRDQATRPPVASVRTATAVTFSPIGSTTMTARSQTA